jgi:hypothetical protein
MMEDEKEGINFLINKVKIINTDGVVKNSAFCGGKRREHAGGNFVFRMNIGGN